MLVCFSAQSPHNRRVTKNLVESLLAEDYDALTAVQLSNTVFSTLSHSGGSSVKAISTDEAVDTQGGSFKIIMLTDSIP